MTSNGQPIPAASRQLSTTAPFGFSFDPREFLEVYRRLGCRSAQFYRNPDNPPTTSEALRIAADADMRFDSIHGLFGAAIDPSSEDADERRRCVALYENEAKLALDLGVSAVVVHPSANRADFVPYHPVQAASLQERRWPCLDDFLQRLAAVGERLDVTFLIENVTYVFPLGHHPAALAQRVLNAGSERIRMCFDTGHAHVVGDAARALLECRQAIEYLHIHDNDGVEDSHLMPGDGTLNWQLLGEAIHAAGLNVPCMLEVFYPVERVDSLVRQGLASRLAAACAL